MKRLARDNLLAIGLFALLILVTIAAAIQQTQSQAPPPLVSTSAAADGALALHDWLAALGIPIIDETLNSFTPPANARLIFMLEPFDGITPDELKALDAWVENGGTLVAAGEGRGFYQVADHYQFSLEYLASQGPALTAQTPLLASPPLTAPAEVHSLAVLSTGRTDFITHLAVTEGLVTVSFVHGQGHVILSTTAYPFSNAGLKEAGNPALVLNLAAFGQRGPVWFDEWHHGLRGSTVEVIGPEAWLRYTPAGHSLVFVAAIIFLVILLRGRGFGRPVPLLQDIKRRGPLEQITALANLSRRAGHRAAVLHMYRLWIKRHFGRRYRLDPKMPDEDYVAALVHFNPTIDSVSLLALLNRLRQKNVSESEMVKLAAEAAEWEQG